MVSAIHKQDSVRRFSLSAALSIVFGILVASSLIVVLSLTVDANFVNTQELQNKRSVANVQLLEDALARDLGPAEDIVDFLARLFADGKLDFDNKTNADAILRGALAGDPDVTSIILYRLDTRHRFGVFRGSDGSYGLVEDDDISNETVQHELAEGARPDEAAWGHLIVIDGEYHANVRRALMDSDQIKGYAIAAVPIQLVSERISSIQVMDNATPFVLNAKGQVVAHPLLAGPAIGDRPSADQQIKPFAEFDDRALRSFSTRQVVDGFTEAARDGVEVSVASGISGLKHGSAGTPGPEDVVFLVRDTSQFAPEPWTVGLYYHAHTFGKEMQRLKTSMIFGLVLLVITIIAAILIGRRLARPVKRITIVAQQISELRLDDIEPLPQSRIREFHDGFQTLNTMVDALSAFATYVPRTLVARLIEKGADTTGHPSEVELTVMFTDIVGFTSRSETMSAGETADFLNHHFALMASQIEKTSGTIDKYIGDGMMAFWGAPERILDHAQRACNAARQIAAALADHNRAVVQSGGEPVRVRIGIHSGLTIVGNIGAPSRVNYTVVGDTVNVCARLQELGKSVDPDAETLILVSGETRAQLPEATETDRVGSCPIRGRSEELDVYRLHP